MDRPAQGHKRPAQLPGLLVDTVDLADLQSWAKEFYIDGGTPDVARAWVLAMDRLLTKKGLIIASAQVVSGEKGGPRG